MAKKLTLKAVKKEAAKDQKRVVFNRSTGMYHVVAAFQESDGIIPGRDEKGRPVLDQRDLAVLRSYI